MEPRESSSERREGEKGVREKKEDEERTDGMKCAAALAAGRRWMQ